MEKIKTFVITPCLFLFSLAEHAFGHVRYLHVMFATGNIYSESPFTPPNLGRDANKSGISINKVIYYMYVYVRVWTYMYAYIL